MSAELQLKKVPDTVKALITREASTNRRSINQARSEDLPLFFEGLDFSHTDIQDAMKILGYSFNETHMPIPIQERWIEDPWTQGL